MDLKRISNLFFLGTALYGAAILLLLYALDDAMPELRHNEPASIIIGLILLITVYYTRWQTKMLQKDADERRRQKEERERERNEQAEKWREHMRAVGEQAERELGI
jgi:hypothetical protein